MSQLSNAGHLIYCIHNVGCVLTGSNSFFCEYHHGAPFAIVTLIELEAALWATPIVTDTCIFILTLRKTVIHSRHRTGRAT